MADKFVNNDPHDLDRVAALEAANKRAPLPLLIAAGFLIYLGMIYVDRFGGDFDYGIYWPISSQKELAAIQEAEMAQADPMMALGRQKYQLCAACHQANGQGQANLAPPLAGSDWVNAAQPDRVIRIVLHGLQGPIEVNGDPWNLIMAGLGGALSDEDVAAVLTYIRGNAEWGNSAGPVTVEQVAAIRAAEGAKMFWSADELMAIPVE